jgi:acyl phosphate:glycerol-3-phosphate acyltransferase
MALAMLVTAYFIGSFPTAYLLVRALRRRDIRSLGDGNMGAQNTFRQVGPVAGITVAFVDCFKGALVIMIAREWGMGPVVIMLSGLAAVAGHNWPWFLGFRGGRGEAVSVGVLLALAPLPMLLALLLGTLALLVTRSVSRASVPLFVSMPLLCWFFGVPGWIIAYSMALPCVAGITSFWRTTRPRLAQVS